jgi:hypothetical protein
MKTYEELLQEAIKEKSDPANARLNVETKAITDLIAQAIENKTYKFARDIRDKDDNITLKCGMLLFYLVLRTNRHFMQ